MEKSKDTWTVLSSEYLHRAPWLTVRKDHVAVSYTHLEKYKKAIHVKALFGEKGYSTLERNSCRPSFDVCGIWGGYTGCLLYTSRCV